MAIWINVQVDHSSPYLMIDYTPIATDETGYHRRVQEYQLQFQTALDSLPESLKGKLLRIGEACFAQIQAPELDLGDVQRRGTVKPWYYQIHRREKTGTVDVAYHLDDGIADTRVSITEATERLIQNVWPSIYQMAWTHFRNRLDAPTTEATPQRKVFLSYRKRADSKLAIFVETIGHRVGREGFLPWLDGWEIKAGDSLPREIAAGLEDAYAIIIVLTPDYPQGKWAREEMEVAITKRVERNLKIIPVMYEACERPTLLQQIRSVDATSHQPEDFEKQFLEIIDALNEVDLNPYRQRV